MFKIFRKRDYWKSVEDVDGYISAVEKLGPGYRELDVTDQGYAESNSIWGQLANLTKLSENNTYDTRKCLYTVWKYDRRKIRSKFNAKKAGGSFSKCTIPSSNSSTKKDNTAFDEVRLYF